MRFGVLGCAAIAWRATLPAIERSPAAELAAVASRDPDRAARFADRFGCRTAPDYDTVLADPGIDAVYIPLPTALHARWAIRALDAGKHVLVEKPLAVDAAEARQVVAASHAAQRTVVEGFMFLHHAQHAAVRERVDAGLIGEPQVFDGTFGIPPLPPGDIRYRRDLGGGALLDLGGYPIRAARLWLGDLAVAGAVLRRSPEYDVDIGGAALLRTPDGRAARVAFGLDQHYRCTYTLWGGEGTITLERAFTAPATLRPALVLERQDHREIITLDADDHFANMIAHFVKATADPDETERQRAAILAQAELVTAVRRAGEE